MNTRANQMLNSPIRKDKRDLAKSGKNLSSLTSEIVMKAAHMGVPVLISRSGITCMGLELAQDLGVTMVARAKGRHFLVYNGDDTVIYDDIPDKRP